MADGIVIDCFAGGGGASEGIRQALGREPDIAINHDPAAIALHTANHPTSTHLTEDIFAVDLARYVQGRHVALMWASPDCTHFSKARGGKPTSRHIRMLPWAVHKHAKAVRPQVIIMENVAEIQTWEDYSYFIASMNSIGYTFECRVLCAADFGAPTSRTRWYAVLRRDGHKTIWPEQTHQDPKKPHVPGLVTWVSIGQYLRLGDWGKPVHGRSRPLSGKTLARLTKGVERYCHLSENQWIMSYYGTGVGQSIHEPLRTITCKDRFALVTKAYDGTHLRMLKPDELKLAQGFPKSYVIDRYADGTRVPRAEQVAKIGNSVVPLMARKIVAANLAA